MSELALARRIVRVLKEKAKKGCDRPSIMYHDPQKWAGFENGNGTEVGGEIDALIAAAERVIKRDERKA